MNNKGNYERQEKDKNDFLTFLRIAAKKNSKQKHPLQGEKLNLESTSKGFRFTEDNLSTNCDGCTLMSRNETFLADHKHNGHSAMVAQIMSFSCSNCDFASFGRNELANHISVEHELEKEKVSILSIDCWLCSEGQIHSICDVQHEIQTSINLKPPSSEESIKGIENINNKKENLMNENFETSEEKNENVSILKDSHSKESSKGFENTNNTKQDLTNVKFESDNSEKAADLISLKKQLELALDIPVPPAPPAEICSQKVSKLENKRLGEVSLMQCKFCSYEARQKVLVVHMKAEHPQEALFGCKICPYKSNWLPNLKTHNNAKHHKVYFKCKHCEYKTVWKNSFHAHMRFKHGIFQKNSKHKRNPGQWMKEKKKLTKCEQCKLEPLATHKCNVSKFNCDFCVYKTTQARYLQTHKKIQHSDNERKWKIINGAKEPIFVCGECDYKAGTKYFMTNHARLNHGRQSVPEEDILHCKFCEFQTEHQRYILKHLKKYHSKHIPKIYKCMLCDFEANSQNETKKHKKEFHSKKFVCNQCEKPFRFLHNLQKHEKSHIEEKPFSCNHCIETFQLFTKLRKHLKTHWSFVCDVCNKSFDRPKKLNRHKIAHSLVRPFDCSQCNKSYREERCLKKHQQTHIQGRPKIACPSCDQSFARVHDLRSHKKIHNKKAHKKEQLFACEQCEKHFKTRWNLGAHQNVHKADKQRTKQFCYKCEFESYDRKSLKHHIAYIHEGTLYYCDQCEFKCGYKASLKLHRRGKHEGVVYHCKKCNFISKHNKIIKQHNEFEHEGITYNCNECDFKSAHKLSLRRHVKTKH